MMNGKRNKHSAMTPDKFTKLCQGLFGEQRKVWRKKFMQMTGLSPATVTQYTKGELPIPMTVRNLLLALEVMKKKNMNIDNYFQIGG